MSLLLALQGAGSTTTLTASKGTLTLTGKTAAFVYKLASNKGALTLTGKAATSVQKLLASKGVLSLTGKDAAFTIATVLTAGKGTLTLTGANADLIEVQSETPADTHDGVGGGGALITYKRPHKKVYDEINEYFDLRNAEQAEQAVDAIAEAAKAAVSEADARAARSGIAALLDEQRNAELRALLALAQDEDDAEAVLVMLELS